MAEKQREKTYKIHPELRYAYRIVGQSVGEQIGDKLQEAGLMDKDWNPRGRLTEDGLNVLIKHFANSLGVALARARLAIPQGFALDQLELADNMTKGFGETHLNIVNNDIKIEFTGERALVRSITSPLDINEALRQQSDDNTLVCLAEIGKRPRIFGSHIIDWPDPEHTV